jgi:hypothetical protein
VVVIFGVGGDGYAGFGEVGGGEVVHCGGRLGVVWCGRWFGVVSEEGSGSVARCFWGAAREWNQAGGVEELLRARGWGGGGCQFVRL